MVTLDASSSVWPFRREGKLEVVWSPEDETPKRSADFKPNGRASGLSRRDTKISTGRPSQAAA